ncbi:hypothetical protein SARC_01155 [Sphaeroforma arctica JP610]|uniref:Uncharacterized protein n=1 Tax=Sphaeroforma arctica JP610 TaxID=667725 RepID=A0A0L0GCS2_9EUKA|nr:hypothetical protein, variant [Sphaeroforma arctica JP610]XP_014160589.1 hypothetical protein SARC_01155 [Sphaeroforma arctica JP610]KNC86686.1 hypothetical protein, variant [Sphaeroforma arctica JP610]KNC86687.1 hypothetical protein SARC_01155 [Sphaeroforma arctica JP610]|eukprot:XP_014160588.1 hypothetical protein, variant [Sphaeroforma arctica JP610]
MLALKRQILSQDESEVNQARLAQAGMNPVFYAHRRSQLLSDTLCVAPLNNTKENTKAESKRRDKQYERTVRFARSEYVVVRSRILQHRYAKYVKSAGPEPENKPSVKVGENDAVDVIDTSSGDMEYVLGNKGTPRRAANEALSEQKVAARSVHGRVRDNTLSPMNSASDGNLARSYGFRKGFELDVIRSEETLTLSGQHIPADTPHEQSSLRAPMPIKTTTSTDNTKGTHQDDTGTGVPHLGTHTSRPQYSAHRRIENSQSFAGTFRSYRSLNSPTHSDPHSPLGNGNTSQRGFGINESSIGAAGSAISSNSSGVLTRSGRSESRLLGVSQNDADLSLSLKPTSASAKTNRSKTVSVDTQGGTHAGAGIWSPSSMQALATHGLSAGHFPAAGGGGTHERIRTTRITMDETSVDSSMSIFSVGVDPVLNNNSSRHPSKLDSPHRRTLSDFSGSSVAAREQSPAQTLKRKQAISVLNYYSFYDSARQHQGREGYHEKPTHTLDALHDAPISCIKFSRVAPSSAETKSRRRAQPSDNNMHSNSSSSYNNTAAYSTGTQRPQPSARGEDAHGPCESEYTLAVAAMNGKISIVRVASGARTCELLHTLEGHSQGVTDLAWLITGELLVSVSLDKTFRVWQVDTGNTLTTVKVGEPVLTCALNPINNNWLVLGTAMGSVRTYNCSLGKPVRGGKMDSSQGINGDIRCLCFNESGTIVWSGSSNGVVHAFGFDPFTGAMTALMRVIIAEKTAITSMSYTPAWRLRPYSTKDTPAPMLLLSVSNNTAVLLHVMDEKAGLVKQKRSFAVAHTSVSVKAGSIFCNQQQGTGGADSADLPGSGACIASGSETGQVYIFDTASKRTVCTLGVNDGVAAQVVGWNRDQTVLAMGNAKGAVMFWYRTGVAS